MVSKKLATCVAVAALLAACSNMGTKQGIGTLGGAAGGALLGSQFGHGTGQLVAVGIGTLLGGFVGSEIGRGLDQNDEMYAQRAAGRAYSAPIGEQITWNNPENGNRGYITPTREGRDQSGSYCREFQQTIIVGGRTEQGMGRACRQPDGSWRIVQ